MPGSQNILVGFKSFGCVEVRGRVGWITSTTVCSYQRFICSYLLRVSVDSLLVKGCNALIASVSCRTGQIFTDKNVLFCKKMFKASYI